MIIVHTEFSAFQPIIQMTHHLYVFLNLPQKFQNSFRIFSLFQKDFPRILVHHVRATVIYHYRIKIFFIQLLFNPKTCFIFSINWFIGIKIILFIPLFSRSNWLKSSRLSSSFRSKQSSSSNFKFLSSFDLSDAQSLLLPSKSKK